MHAAIYCRVSTGKQANSLEGQDQRCLEYARLKGLTTHASLTFADEKVSGRKPIRERPDGARLMQVLEHGWAPLPGAPASGTAIPYQLQPVQHLVVAKIDRLGRKAGDLLAVWDFCKERGITLHIVDMCGDSITNQSNVGRIIYGMLSLFAEFEREMIVDRVQQTIDQLFAEGRVAGHIPYGFDEGRSSPECGASLRSPPSRPMVCAPERGASLRRSLVPNPTEQQWLRTMTQLRWHDPARHYQSPGSSGVKLSYDKIAKHLNAHGVPTKTGILGGWQAGNVAKVLNSRHTREWILATQASAQAAHA